MSIRKQVTFKSSYDQRNQAAKDREKVHMIPCSHNYCGPADVSVYFDSLTTVTKTGNLESSLYGHKLIGTKGKHSSPEILEPDVKGRIN